MKLTKHPQTGKVVEVSLDAAELNEAVLAYVRDRAPKAKIPARPPKAMASGLNSFDLVLSGVRMEWGQ